MNIHIVIYVICLNDKNDVNGTKLNQNYNRMLTDIKGESGIPNDEKESCLIF